MNNDMFVSDLRYLQNLFVNLDEVLAKIVETYDPDYLDEEISISARDSEKARLHMVVHHSWEAIGVLDAYLYDLDPMEKIKSI